MTTLKMPNQLRVFVFDSPRTCSHLFRQLFLSHPQLGHILEPFLFASVCGHEGVTPLLTSTEAAWNVVEQARATHPELEHITYSKANSTLEASISEREQRNLIPWIKDHAMWSIKPEIVLSSLRSNSLGVDQILADYTNPTLIDDALLRSFTPIFLIRHPALVMGSYWEVNSQSIGSDVHDEQFKWITSIRWVRILFEFYRKRTGEQPLVVDGEDVVHRTVEVTDEICSRFGLDPTGVALHWEPEPLSDRPGEFFKKRLRGSKGVERDKEAMPIDLDITTAKWSAQYGEDIARGLRRRTEEELPDYQYMLQFKLL